MAETTEPKLATVKWLDACLSYLQEVHGERFSRVLKGGLWCATHPYVLNHFYQEPPGGPASAFRPHYQQRADERGWHFEYPYDPLQQSLDPGRSPLGGTNQSPNGDPNGLIATGEAFQQLLKKHFDAGPVPVVGTAGGIHPIPAPDVEALQQDDRFPPYNRDSHAEATLALYNWIVQQGPPWMFGLAITSEADLYDGPGGPVPAVAKLAGSPVLSKEIPDLDISVGMVFEQTPARPPAPTPPPAPIDDLFDFEPPEPPLREQPKPGLEKAVPVVVHQEADEEPRAIEPYVIEMDSEPSSQPAAWVEALLDESEPEPASETSSTAIVESQPVPSAVVPYVIHMEGPDAVDDDAAPVPSPLFLSDQPDYEVVSESGVFAVPDFSVESSGMIARSAVIDPADVPVPTPLVVGDETEFEFVDPDDEPVPSGLLHPDEPEFEMIEEELGMDGLPLMEPVSEPEPDVFIPAPAFDASGNISGAFVFEEPIVEPVSEPEPDVVVPAPAFEPEESVVEPVSEPEPDVVFSGPKFEAQPVTAAPDEHWLMPAPGLDPAVFVNASRRYWDTFHPDVIPDARLVGMLPADKSIVVTLVTGPDEVDSAAAYLRAARADVQIDAVVGDLAALQQELDARAETGNAFGSPLS
jgi:hypothetical protein